MSHRNLMLLIVASVFCFVCFIRAERSPYARFLAAGYTMIDRLALEEPPDQELFNGAMEGMVAVLNERGDEHTSFIEAEDADAFQEDIEQEFAGVGIMLGLVGEPPFPVVIAPPLPGTPAFAAGIRRGDRILAVDGKSTAGMELADIVRLVRGPAGEVVTISVRYENDTQVRDVPLKRAIIVVESIRGDVRDRRGEWQYHAADRPQIGYVRIIKFGDKTADELRRVMAQLTESDAQALVIDLRDDYGGALDAAIDVCDLFLPAGRTILTIRGRGEQMQDRYETTGSGRYLQIPLVVLVNHNSASASEIVAACLQDHGRAVVAGERSYGKGTVQQLLSIESGRSRLKLTTATYWRPSNKNIHRMPGDQQDDEWGVEPSEGLRIDLSEEEHRDWQVYRSRRDRLSAPADGDPEELFNLIDHQLPEDYSDRVLDRAIEYLESRLGHRRSNNAPDS